MSDRAAYTLALVMGLVVALAVWGTAQFSRPPRCTCVGPCIPDPCTKENLRELQRRGMPISDELLEAVGK